MYLPFGRFGGVEEKENKSGGSAVPPGSLSFVRSGSLGGPWACAGLFGRGT